MNSYQFQSPSNIIVSGATGSGKSYFTYRLIKERDAMFPKKFHKLLYCYSCYQNLYATMQKEIPNLEFKEGMPSMSDIETISSEGLPSLLIIDDFMLEASQDKDKIMQKLFSIWSHHKDITIIYIVQNMFNKGSASRNLALNAQYLVLFQNLRDTMQVNVLARQTGFGKVLTEAYDDSLKTKYGYLVINLTGKNPKEETLCTSIFPSDGAAVSYTAK
jgi:hypothetical protein